MKTVLLVNPKTANKYYHRTRDWVDTGLVRFIRRHIHRRFSLPSHSRCAVMPPTTLLALEALFEQRCHTIAVDEQVEEIDFRTTADLVAVTSTTPQYRRAREIASIFRRRGIPTAIGGIHATCLPEECATDFDTVCVGEAEGYIDDLVRDLSSGHLRSLYTNEVPVDLDATPFYRYPLRDGKYLPFYVVSFSRGCNFSCEFCSVQATLGKYRTRSVESVVQRIAESGARDVWFPDASLTGDREKARALCKALIPLKVNWLGCMTLNIAQDEAMLDLMAESGCWLVSVGFETLSPSNLKRAGKPQNRVEVYRHVIRALHDRRIAIEGNFVFGFDGDTEGVFERTATFAIRTGIDLPEFYVLTPYPGTSLHARLLKAGRIVDHDWSHYDNTHFRHLPVFEPRQMSRTALRDGCRRAERMAYGLRDTLFRLRNSGICRPAIWVANYIFMRRILEQGHLIPCGETRCAG